MRSLAGLLLAAASAGAQAHGFDERYDLPVPLAWVVMGACAVVALTFAAAAVFVRGGETAARRGAIALHVPRSLQHALRGLGLALFALALAAALWGSRDPLMNLAPTLVWIVAWLGLTFASALLGGVWTLLDPWRSLFDMLDATARKLGRTGGLAFGRPVRGTPGSPSFSPSFSLSGRPLGKQYPAALGQWPAVLLLLVWCWLEVVDPLASSPERLGRAMLAWTVVNVAGMALCGAAAWQARVDVFAVFFATLSRLAPLQLRSAIAVQPPPAAGQVAFVMAMLSTVVFDGLHGGSAWLIFEGLLRKTVPQWLDVNGRIAGSLGLVAVWLGFQLAYTATARLSLALMRPVQLGTATLALTLVPIALAYAVAHNFSSLLIQGQRVFALLSDPFGWQWDLFGTARWYPDIGFVDARTTWFVALVAIVTGHVVSIWGSHRLVLAAGVPPHRATLAMLPLTLLMVGCTALSLLLIAEPMVAVPTP